MRLGLRFARSQRRVLKNIRDGALEAGQGDVGLYDRAIEAAETGEPLIVVCERASEVEHMAALFAYLGCRRPVIEELSQDAPHGAGR